MWADFEKIISGYREENWGIYEEEADKEIMVRVSDAYYGDGSAISQKMVMAGKPVMLQNYDC